VISVSCQFVSLAERERERERETYFNPLNPELNPIYYLLALLGAHHFFPR